MSTYLGSFDTLSTWGGRLGIKVAGPHGSILFSVRATAPVRLYCMLLGYVCVGTPIASQTEEWLSSNLPNSSRQPAAGLQADDLLPQRPSPTHAVVDIYWESEVSRFGHRGST